MKIIHYNDKWWLVDNDELTPIDQEKRYEITKIKDDKRTITQNASIHKYFSLLAEALNDAGYSVPFVLNKKQHELINKVFDWGIAKLPEHTKIIENMRDRLLSKNEDELSWSMILVKELLWKPIQKAILNKESTTNLKKDEIDIVYLNLNKLISTKFGISIAFPSINSMIHEQNYKDG